MADLPSTVDRELLLEGSVNFRDLGGLTARTGAVVRAGRLFRSDALARLTSADLERLAGLRISTLIDLRTVDEITRTGPSPLLNHGAAHLHLSILDGDVTTREYDPDRTLGALYEEMLRTAGRRFRAIFETLAEPERLPAVVHCTAGKDRTGVTVALVLRLLGIPDELIVADYAITDRNIARLIESRRRAGQPISSVRVPEQFMRAVPETMETFLATIDDTWGSVDSYLDFIAVSPATRTAIRENLLSPAA
jgi:protein-tyrosine phosphatase